MICCRGRVAHNCGRIVAAALIQEIDPGYNSARNKVSMSDFKPVSLIYPIAFFDGVLFLCAWALHGKRFVAPIPHLQPEITADHGIE